MRSQRGRFLVWAAAAMPTALVGISGVYLGVHWTTDVIGGWIFGILWRAVLVSGWATFGHPARGKVILRSDRTIMTNDHVLERQPTELA
jgi:membrane-associated phospholipid phosphatase